MDECPECGSEMLYQNAWDLGEGMTMTEYICSDVECCETSVQVFKKSKEDVEDE